MRLNVALDVAEGLRPDDGVNFELPGGFHHAHPSKAGF